MPSGKHCIAAATNRFSATHRIAIFSEGIRKSVKTSKKTCKNLEPSTKLSHEPPLIPHPGATAGTDRSHLPFGKLRLVFSLSQDSSGKQRNGYMLIFPAKDAKSIFLCDAQGFLLGAGTAPCSSWLCLALGRARASPTGTARSSSTLQRHPKRTQDIESASLLYWTYVRALAW